MYHQSQNVFAIVLDPAKPVTGAQDALARINCLLDEAETQRHGVSRRRRSRRFAILGSRAARGRPAKKVNRIRAEIWSPREGRDLSSFLHFIHPLYTASGFAVGALVGFTGVGGGSLMTPLLVLLFGIHPATAVGTDLLYAGLTKISGSIVHGYNGAIDWRVTRRLASGSVPAAALTLLALAHFGVDAKETNVTITTTLGFALILTAVTLLFRRRLLKAVVSFFDQRSHREIAALTVALGALVGVLVSISSVGAGAIGVTVLLMLYPTMPTVRIVGSDIAHAVPLTLLAGAGHWWLGSVDWQLLVSLLLGSIPGIAIGSHFASLVPERVLRPLLAGTLAIVGGKLAF